MSEKFSIFKHILHHDEKTIEIKNESIRELTEKERKEYEGKTYDRNKIKNFIISFDPVQFNSVEDIKDKLNKYIDKLSKHEFKSEYKKHYKSTKTGLTKEYTYQRIATMNNSLISIHLNTNNPHLHIIFNRRDTDKSFGKNYSTLKKELNRIDNDLKIITTLSRDKEQAIIKNRDYKFQSLEKELTKFSWALEKNRDMNKFKSTQLSLLNIQEKLNEYIHNNGSVSFANKISSKLIEKGYFASLELEKSKEHKYIESLKLSKNYSKLFEKIVQDCKLAKPLNIEIRNFIEDKSHNKFEIDFKNKIIDLYKVSSFTYSDDMKSKIINIKEIENNERDIRDFVKKFEIDKYKFIKENKYLKEKELREDLKSINITYKDFEKDVEKSISAIIYENNFEYMKNQIYSDNINEIRDSVKNLNSELSEKYVNSISEKIYYENRRNIEIER